MVTSTVIALMVGIYIWFSASKATREKVEQEKLAERWRAEEATEAAERAAYFAAKAAEEAREKLKRETEASWPGEEPVQDRTCSAADCRPWYQIEYRLVEAFLDDPNVCPFCGDAIEDVYTVETLAKEKAAWMVAKLKWGKFRELFPQESLKCEVEEREANAEWEAYFHQEYKAAVAAHRRGCTATDWFFCPRCDRLREAPGPHGPNRPNGGAECRCPQSKST